MSDITYMYHFLDPNGYPLIHQSGVQQACFPMDNCPYNACWDGFMAPNGQVYLAAASEVTVGEYAKMVEYRFDDNSFHDLFYSKDVILPPERAITSSKFHTSTCCMEDGKIITLTHTTDKAPAHPTWLYLQYYDHVFEGFPGSSIIVYDPKTGKAENIGIPVPRESMYGGVYCKENHCYYMLGYARGHLYEYSFDTRRVTDFGKATEFETFRIHLGPDNNVYGITKSGTMFKLDTKKRELINLKHTFPAKTGGPNDCMSVYTRAMGGALNLPGTAKFLFTLFQSEGLYQYDTSTDELVCFGNFRSADRYCEGFDSYEGVFSMQLDRDNVLWYPLTCYSGTSNGAGDFSFRLGPSLMRWDLFRGKSPENLGMIGTPNRANATVPSIMLDNERDRMYLVDTNHACDGLSLLAIDMKQFKKHMYDKGPKCCDPYIYPQTPRYVKMRAASDESRRIMAENSADFHPLKMIPVYLWRSCRPEDSGVIGLTFKNATTAAGLCGNNSQAKYSFEIKTDGTLTSFQKLNELSGTEQKHLAAAVSSPLPTLPQCTTLPCRSGRRYKAVLSAAADWKNGEMLLGTQDGMFAVLKKDGVYSLGAAAPNGPIRAIATDEKKTIAYGVAGDIDDLGTVFSYDDQHGLQILGRLYCPGGEYPTAASNLLSSVIVSPDGKLVVIGSADRLGVVWILTVK